ncbi:short chain dehydrogenase [Geomonas subterranea]|uniref:Short chain dehydrogenase n=1 Tax=Geomonas subterranea TaxID=2847989 RepID=A0ABX8LMS6_9BACT|nr:MULTISPECIES: short chain dehydrogenase [Geomonas]QXE92232.1 short chain dehydrogenase [Geomonas subterranea]QXM09668.1 short chain dehydrogenase [Geomonas subterranea]
MRIIVIGATGTIGKAVAKQLATEHEVIKVASKSGDHRVDMSSKDSIENMFREVGPFDALACAAGVARFAPLAELSDEDFQTGLFGKLMGQVNLVRVGMNYINDNGSFTLTSGVLSHQPMPGSASISMVNAGLEGFVRAAALELPRGIRINVVSPPWVKETLEALGMDSSGGMPAQQVAQAYWASIHGTRSGVVINAKDFA